MKDYGFFDMLDEMAAISRQNEIKNAMFVQGLQEWTPSYSTMEEKMAEMHRNSEMMTRMCLAGLI